MPQHENAETHLLISVNNVK